MPLGANKAAIMGVSGVSTADVVLIQSQTASGDASISFTSGIDSTYGEYIFKFYNINVGTDQATFHFQVNATDGADYNDSVMTTTHFTARQNEAGNDSAFAYNGGSDLAQAADFQQMGGSLGNGSDESLAGELHLFNPASTTYVKHFYGQNSGIFYNNYEFADYWSGYINDTTAIDDIQFKVSTGVFDGTIKMWGVK